MILAIDVGNTTVTLGVMQDFSAKAFWRLTSGRHTSDELGIALRQLLQLAEIQHQSLEVAVIGSVVPGMTPLFEEAVQNYLQIDCHRVESNLQTRMKLNIDRPHELGVDRLIDALAAEKFYGSPVVVADFGTAITLDVITDGPVYQGGAICPGLVTSLEALFGSTSKLPKIELIPSENAVGKYTAQCIQSGVVRGTACLIDGLIEQFEMEMGCRFQCVATGGHGKTIAESSRRITHVDSKLTLKGLELIEREYFQC